MQLFIDFLLVTIFAISLKLIHQKFHGYLLYYPIHHEKHKLNALLNCQCKHLYT